MSERYSKLFSLPENLYAEGSPVIISAGALLKDNKTGRVLAQLKFQNIGTKAIKALKVLVHPLDTANQAIGADVEKEYLDLDENIGDEFGHKEPVAIGNQSTRAFSAKVIRAVFTDGSTWESSSGETWSQLPAPEPLENELQDSELVKQYKIEYGADSKFVPRCYADLWQCKCGSWNREHACWKCKSNKDIINLDLKILKKNRDDRVVKEAEETERRRQEEIKLRELEIKRKDEKTKKVKRAAILILPVAILILVFTTLIYPQIKAERLYKDATQLLLNEEYDAAAEAFSALGKYKDSESQIKECHYQLGRNYLKNSQYLEALAILKDLPGYKDTESLIESIYKKIGSSDSMLDFLAVFHPGMKQEIVMDFLYECFGENVRNPFYRENSEFYLIIDPQYGLNRYLPDYIQVVFHREPDEELHMGTLYSISWWREFAKDSGFDKSVSSLFKEVEQYITSYLGSPDSTDKESSLDYSAVWGNVKLWVFYRESDGAKVISLNTNLKPDAT